MHCKNNAEIIINNKIFDIHYYKSMPAFQFIGNFQFCTVDEFILCLKVFC